MAGPMGQPAIQKPPTFNIEGDGERVLSKKKLEDLVRQVTGGAGGDGAEMLDPDVEEVSLVCVTLRSVLITFSDSS
jgi:transcription initiation factor TFIID subunit 12